MLCFLKVYLSPIALTVTKLANRLGMYMEWALLILTVCQALSHLWTLSAQTGAEALYSYLAFGICKVLVRYPPATFLSIQTLRNRHSQRRAVAQWVEHYALHANVLGPNAVISILRFSVGR